MMMIGKVAVAPRAMLALLDDDATATVGVCVGGVGSLSEHAENSVKEVRSSDVRIRWRIAALGDSKALPGLLDRRQCGPVTAACLA